MRFFRIDLKALIRTGINPMNDSAASTKSVLIIED
jgi:hypothetical protein